jgi:hypothetical protein
VANDYAAALAGLRLSVDKPGRVYLKHPGNDAPIAESNGGPRAYVDMMSRDSAEWQKRERAVQEERTRKAADGSRITPEEVLADHVETLALMTRDWFLVDLAGAKIELPFGLAAARYAYSEPGLVWLRDQAAQGAGNRSLFTPARSAA